MSPRSAWPIEWDLVLKKTKEEKKLTFNWLCQGMHSPSNGKLRQKDYCKYQVSLGFKAWLCFVLFFKRGGGKSPAACSPSLIRESEVGLCNMWNKSAVILMCFSQKNPQVMYLEQELESLKAVLEIKNEKLHQQDLKLMKMEKLVGLLEGGVSTSCVGAHAWVRSSMRKPRCLGNRTAELRALEPWGWALLYLMIFGKYTKGQTCIFHFQVY